VLTSPTHTLCKWFIRPWLARQACVVAATAPAAADKLDQGNGKKYCWSDLESRIRSDCRLKSGSLTGPTSNTQQQKLRGTPEEFHFMPLKVRPKVNHLGKWSYNALTRPHRHSECRFFSHHFSSSTRVPFLSSYQRKQGPYPLAMHQPIRPEAVEGCALR
jgi:hypothetical protein